MFTLKAVIIQDHICTNSKLKVCIHLPEEDPENVLHLALFWVSFLDLVFGCEARVRVMKLCNYIHHYVLFQNI